MSEEIDGIEDHAERARLRRAAQAETSAAWLREIEEMDDVPYLPPEWTAEHVAVRLVECAEIISRLPNDFGPRALRAAGGNYFHTEEEVTEAKRFAEAELTAVSKRRRPDATELKRMDEVIDWPMRFLKHDPETASVISNWAVWKAQDRKIEEMIDQFFYADRRRFYGKRREGLDLIAKGLSAANEVVT